MATSDERELIPVSCQNCGREFHSPITAESDRYCSERCRIDDDQVNNIGVLQSGV